MISPDRFCARFGCASGGAPHRFRLPGAGDLLLHGEAQAVTAILLAAHEMRAAPDRLALALELAARRREGPDLFLSQLAGGNLCFHILSPGEADETLQAAALLEEATSLLRRT